MRRAIFASLFAAWIALPFDGGQASIVIEATRAPLPKLHIVIAGISEYRDPRLGKLRSPANEAEHLAGIFSSLSKRVQVGSLTVLKNRDATRAAVIDAYRSTLARAAHDELVLFYWTGHSGLDPRTSRLVLVPHDAIFSDDRSEGLSSSGLDIQQDLISITPPEQKVVIIGDGCNIGDGRLGPLLDQHPYLAVLASSKSDERAFESLTRPYTDFFTAFADVLTDERSDLDGDGRLSLEELYVQLYQKMMRLNSGFSRQHPSLVGLHSHRLMLAAADVPGEVIVAAPNSVVEVAMSDLPSSPLNVILNGEPLQDNQYRVADGKLAFLGAISDTIKNGMNFLTIGRRNYQLMKAGRALRAFQTPYKNSHAIIVAIDDYERKNDPLHRGPTSFPEISGMVARAEELKSTLVTLGFPQQNITVLRNEHATSDAIEALIRDFWAGGKKADADRVFFYFGGHGDEFQKNNLLVTYDYDRPRRALTSFHARELIERHARNIQANHVLFALDVCYSGLVFLGGDEDGRTTPDLEETERLAVIERNVTGPARNIIVAGTGDQRAMWENGGIFTKALIDALGGKADTNNDGVIEFEELGVYVRDRVTKLARVNGFRQVPRFTALDLFGDGRIMFVRSPTTAAR